MGQGGSWHDEEEPAAMNKHSQVFHLDLNAEELGQAYKQVIKEIRDEICELLKLERKNQDPLNCMPETVGGRLYTPLPRDNQPTFLVQVKGSDAKVVSFLFSWLDLYCGGFYAKEVYYLFQDFDLLMLPPPSQLKYKPVIGKGVVLLSGGSGYAAMGGRNINIGRPACYRYGMFLLLIMLDII